MVQLVTVRFSHFCEKARWALDHAGIAFEEHAHLPVFSWLAAFAAAGRRTVPALAGGKLRLADSTDILRWAAPDLYPASEVAVLEEDFDAHLGPAVRRVAYHFLFQDPSLFGELLAGSA